jgi:hypothetical protein
VKYDGADLTDAAAPAVARMYESIEALVAAVPKAQVTQFKENEDGRPIRMDLTAGLVGADDTAATEALYWARSANLDGTGGIIVEKLADITWTTSAADTIPTAQGGRANHKFPKTAAVTDTGVAEARTGHALRSTGANAPPAMVTLFDVGPARAIIRTFAKGTATSVAGISGRWR